MRVAVQVIAEDDLLAGLGLYGIKVDALVGGQALDKGQRGLVVLRDVVEVRVAGAQRERKIVRPKAEVAQRRLDDRRHALVLEQPAGDLARQIARARLEHERVAGVVSGRADFVKLGDQAMDHAGGQLGASGVG